MQAPLQIDAPANLAGLRCEAIAGHPDYVALGDIDGVAVDLRYAGEHNVFGRALYAFLDCAWLHRDAAAALSRAVLLLRQRHPMLQILVLDAVRPQRVQQMLWEVLRDTPLSHYLGEPQRGSIHSFGMALDVTLVDDAGEELDMGTGFDAMCECSHPALEPQLLAQGLLTSQQVMHRRWLRSAMVDAGFQVLPHEWWHFDCGDPAWIRAHYPRVL